MEEKFTDLVRTESFSFYKWAAGISMFFITASLSILALRDDVGLWVQISVIPCVIFLLLNVIFVWRWHKKSLYDVFNFLSKLEQGKKPSIDEEKKFKQARETAIKELENKISITFWIGFSLFLGFLIYYIIY